METEYAVTRDGTALVTLHGGSETTARSDAVDELERELEALTDDGAIEEWELGDDGVYEHPTAPFEPYTIAVDVSVTVAVEAPDEHEAGERGANAIDSALANAGANDVSYTEPPAVTTR
ncbi:hypothetical protein [Natrarchaeobaculum aegyptiacum]|uniref:Uncharacterized protein n=1 Tax=Natrarchaeobaculum aegyptiacum TaxID=745377 RepID=A0A2Z2I055_9EURY|nr:hypothetical protein [Natrarchaeobaculum aegyptiacum]ARS89488.1 hypothetical protein B1756_06830 [Natrarchaeobaculum aegyptiacum]